MALMKLVRFSSWSTNRQFKAGARVIPVITAAHTPWFPKPWRLNLTVAAPLSQAEHAWEHLQCDKDSVQWHQPAFCWHYSSWNKSRALKCKHLIRGSEATRGFGGGRRRHLTWCQFSADWLIFLMEPGWRLLMSLWVREREKEEMPSEENHINKQNQWNWNLWTSQGDVLQSETLILHLH